MMGSARSFERSQADAKQPPDSHKCLPDRLNKFNASNALQCAAQRHSDFHQRTHPTAGRHFAEHSPHFNYEHNARPCLLPPQNTASVNTFGSCTTLRHSTQNLQRSSAHAPAQQPLNKCKAHCQPNAPSGYCSIYTFNETERMPTCSCKHWYEQNARCGAEQHNYKPSYRRASMYPHVTDCDYASRVTDEDESVFPGFMDGDFRMLHRNIPALRRTGVNTNSIRQYYYPDGGWGWIICGLSFLVHVLTTGFQLSYGLLLFYTLQHLHNPNGLELLGALNCSVSMLMAPLVVILCKRKSTRLLSVVGGLVLPLGVLFTSFATEYSQIMFSYGFVVGVGIAMVRETCSIILGTYFKKKRHFVEMVAMSGEGVGIALFSVVIKEGIGEKSWRQGLQIVTAMVAITFFMGLFYRPASLYHPHRRAIEHLKNQQKKMRANKPSFNAEEQKKKKNRLWDASIVQSGTVKILLMISCVSALGVYTPMFLMVLNAAKEGSDIQELILLQAFLGISSTTGVVLAGLLTSRPLRIRTYVMTTKLLSQLFLAMVAISILLLSFIMGYQGLCILSWLYGIGFGGFRYSIKVLALDCVKLKQFPTIWGLMRGTESIPVLISVPLTSFLNDYSLKYGRAGYYICSAAVAIAGIIIFFIGYERVPEQTKYRLNANNVYQELPTVSTALQNKLRTQPAAHLQQQHYDYEYQPRNLINRSCVSLNQMDASVGCCGSRLRVECTVPQSNCMRSNSQSEFRMPGMVYKDDIVRQRPLQRSLSFIQPQYYYEHGPHICRDLPIYQTAPYYSRFNSNAPLLCTCSSPLSNVQSSKSRSVPEGLSFVSQQCSCERNVSRDYHDYTPAGLKASNLGCTCARQLSQTPAHPATCHTTQRTQLRRSQSLTRPLQYIEQITTSV